LNGTSARDRTAPELDSTSASATTTLCLDVACLPSGCLDLKALQISLFLPKISLLPKIISLLIFAGNLLRSGGGTGAFRFQIASKSPEIAKFPVNFPVIPRLLENPRNA
jgi:hypothetical protein